MKFLLIGDIHFRNESPINRKDDIVEVFKDKFKQLKQIIKRNKIDYVLTVGDILDRSVSSVPTINLAEELLSSLEIPVYSILGNHDLVGNVVNGYNKSSIFLLSKLCSNLNIILEEYIDLEDTRIYFNHYGDNNFIIKDKDDSKFNIVLTHSNIYDGDSMFDSINCRDLITNADFLFTGHIHSKFLYNNIYNAGSLVRLTRAEGDYNREVEVGILDVNDRVYSLKKYKLNISNYQDVFNAKDIVSIKRELNNKVCEILNNELQSVDEIIIGLKNKYKEEVINKFKELY